MNDTVTGDPLMTVPILTDENVMSDSNVESLCYEVHGEANAYFNLITDKCTSVNAFYEEAVPSNANIDLNVVTKIGVRAVGRGENFCVDIKVDLLLCTTLVSDMEVDGSYHVDGITVTHYASSSRVRISVPNCGETMLVMWVFCRTGHIQDPVSFEYHYINFLRFVVMRGLNLNLESHGLIGMLIIIVSCAEI